MKNLTKLGLLQQDNHLTSVVPIISPTNGVFQLIEVIESHWKMKNVPKMVQLLN